MKVYLLDNDAPQVGEIYVVIAIKDRVLVLGEPGDLERALEEVQMRLGELSKRLGEELE